MVGKTEFARIFETILSVPGMNEPVRVDLKLSRKNILLLHKILERGMAIKGDEEKGNNIMDIVSPDSLDELRMINEELLQKAQLADTNEKLREFTQ